MKNRFLPRKNAQGFAFPDFIKTERQPRRYHSDDVLSRALLRGHVLFICLFFFVGLLLIRLFFIQIIQGNYYKTLSDTNRTRTITIHAPRGIIFDRNATPLVFNVPGFQKAPKSPSDKAVVLSREEAVKRIANGEKDIEIASFRQYPFTDVTAHVLGYIGQSDLLGKTGIEQEYEEKLKGVTGRQLVEVDAMGKIIRTLGQEDPISGMDITLTLDIKLQQKAYSAMKDVQKGAVVVTTPLGKVLALLSKPSFDTNLFTLAKDYKTASDSAYANVTAVLTDTDKQPVLNRAISGMYQPGSTFKLIVAAAGLQRHIIDKNFTVTDTGVLRIGKFSFANWYGKPEGEMNVVRGIQRSNDIFFYKLAEKIGVQKLSETAQSFGLGNQVGIDLPGEAKGNVPTDAWKQKVIGEQWYLGDTYHYGIGQGYLLVTPLQVNSWTQTLANKGILYQPHVLQQKKDVTKYKVPVSEETQAIIRQGMIASCSPNGGVVWPLFDFKVQNAKLQIDGKNFLEVPEASGSAKFKDYRQITIACKTGTAQHGAETNLPHAWITLWAPAYDPQIIVTVLAESSGEGSNVAAPIAKKILEEWFSR